MSVSITAGDVSKLRGMTGAGMMDCKEALKEASGDFGKAVEILRKRGEKVSSLRSGRRTTEGCVVARVSQGLGGGLVLALTCETDFVARNGDFRGLAGLCATLAAEHSCQDAEQLGGISHEGVTLEEHITDMAGRVGEKVAIGGYETLSGDCVVPYVHAGSKLGVLVALSAGGDEAQEVGKNIAMQVAAMDPIALSREEVPNTVVDSELAVGRALAEKEGKPAHLAEKIATGRLNKFFKERTLLGQAYIKNDKISVSQYLKERSQPLTVQGFKRLAIG